MPKYFFRLLVVWILLAAACQPLGGSGDSPAAPGAGESALPSEGDSSLSNPDNRAKNKVRGPATLQESGILIQDGRPMLSLAGTLPTPCHELAVDISPPDDQNRIRVAVYSLVDPDVICIQVLEGFSETVPLTGLSAGSYTVEIDGQAIGQFTLADNLPN